MKRIAMIERLLMLPILIAQIVFIILGPFLEVVDTKISSGAFMIIGLLGISISTNLLQMCYRYIKKLEQANKQDVVSSSQTVEASSYEVVNTNNNVGTSSQAKV